MKYSHSSDTKPSDEALKLHTDDLESDDELPTNTVGNVPKQWYDGMDHVGYDVDGKKVARPVRKDGIDRFLAGQDDKNYRWTYFDEEAGEEVTLSKRDLQILTRMHSGAVAMPESDMYVELTDIYSSERELHPLNDPVEPKRRFLPSKWETQRINKMVRAIRAGKLLSRPKREVPEVYLLWGTDGAALDYNARSKAPPPIPAPKQAPPGHAASYNPPPEYLLTPEEEEAWKAAHPSERPYGLDFIPRRFASLRHVPLYAPGARERFERCLDLYLCPRMTRRREDATPEALLPKLPDPSALKPFPNALATAFGAGHDGARVRSVCFDPSGQYLASGGDDGSVRVWEVASGRCLRKWAVGAPGAGVACVAWNPNPEVQVLAAVSGSDLLLIYPGTCTPANAQATFDALAGARGSDAGAASAAAGGKRGRDGAAAGSDDEDGAGGEEADGSDGEERAKAAEPALRTCKWTVASSLTSPDDLLPRAGRGAPDVSGVRVTVAHGGTLRQVVWHRKGDYAATVAPQASVGQVMIHQLTRGASQCPLGDGKGQTQAVSFHPSKPLFYVASHRTVRVYHLTKQTLLQKLEGSGAKWISSLSVHPSGDHVLVGSYDARVVWFDTELSSKPFRSLRYHAKGVRRAVFHPGACPLMATASDDGSVHVFHARVFSDFTQNPLVVPVKILRGHEVTPEGLGVLDAAFHPTLPWLATAGADGQVKLWHNLP